MAQARQTGDVVPQAFPGRLGDLAHQVIGRAVVRLVDAGLELATARAIVRDAVTAIIEEFES